MMSAVFEGILHERLKAKQCIHQLLTSDLIYIKDDLAKYLLRTSDCVSTLALTFERF